MLDNFWPPFDEPLSTPGWSPPRRVDLVRFPSSLDEDLQIAQVQELNGVLYSPPLDRSAVAIAKIEGQFGNQLQILDPCLEIQSGKKVKPPRDLLQKFLDLTEAPDERIQRFVVRYGGLGIYRSPDTEENAPRTREANNETQIEYCEVWRYFGRTLYALTRIGDAIYKGKTTSGDDWAIVYKIPAIMRRRLLRLCHDHRRSISEIANRAQDWWCLLTMLSQEQDLTRDRKRTSFVNFLNTFLRLGSVETTVQWPRGVPGSRPQIAHSQASLLSCIALQFSLRVAGQKAFILCCHCHKQYLPPDRGRLPKEGYRNFCPECRKNGEPVKYAVRDYKSRKRHKAGNGSETIRPANVSFPL